MEHIRNWKKFNESFLDDIKIKAYSKWNSIGKSKKVSKVKCKSRGINDVYKITVGKTYDVIQQDNVSFYINDDTGVMAEVLRNKFDIVEYK